MKPKTVEIAYVIRCYPKKGSRRCGTGSVLMRMSLEDAKVAARTHAARKQHDSQVFRVVLEPEYSCTYTENATYVPPKPRQDDWDGYGA